MGSHHLYFEIGLNITVNKGIIKTEGVDLDDKYHPDFRFEELQ